MVVNKKYTIDIFGNLNKGNIFRYDRKWWKKLSCERAETIDKPCSIYSVNKVFSSNALVGIETK